MDNDTILREATWMVPFLLFMVLSVMVVVVGLVKWVVNTFVSEAKDAGKRFRADVMERLEKQDDVLDNQTSTMIAIKDLLTAEVHKLREKLINHESRITAVERHNFPLRRFNDKDTEE